MNFKIYWLNVSRCSSNELILEKMHRLKVLLQADDLDIKYNTYNGNTKNEIIHMRNYLRKILDQPEFRDCLIVLVDVKDEHVIRAFELNCKIFVTTRHIEKLEFISSDMKTKVDIDRGFTEDESAELFRNAFDGNLPDDMKEHVELFHKRCNGHPFLMSGIATQFKNFPESPQARKLRCERWLQNLEDYKLNDEQIKMSVMSSLKFLDIPHQMCYKKMVIFSDNSDIPIKVLEKIWDTNEQQTEEIVLKLLKYSLIEKFVAEDNDKVCTLHYLHFHFLKQYVSADEQIDYHRHLVEKYDVERLFTRRTELDLDFPNDNYFHFFIPYHLVGAKMEHLFDIYLDFGFLEQKLRYTHLPNTVGDLIRFEANITRGDAWKMQLLNELTVFLTYNEQLVFKSEDVTLLQCALNSSGLVQQEAQRQIGMFPDRVWMQDINHEENHTQIVPLHSSSLPHLVRFVKPNDNLVCLISLHDNNILLHDISQEYSEDPVLYKTNEDWGGSMKITDMQVFRHHAFLTLNEIGKLSVYTLKSTAARRVSGPSRATSKVSDGKTEKLLQVINTGNSNDKITCFNIFDSADASPEDIDLIVGTLQGNIKFYQWRSNKFEENKKLAVQTHFGELFRMAHAHDYVMLLNSQGEVRYINLVNSAVLAVPKPWTKLPSPINLHQGICASCLPKPRPITVCVFRDKVVQVMHEEIRKNDRVLFIEYDDLFVANDDFDDNQILSSTMSKDAEYLILGTKKGIIVMHRFSRRVLYRRNISDQVLSLDIYRYQDEVTMYILSSVFKDAGPVISLYGFDEHREDMTMISNEMTFLVGEDLFDVVKSEDKWQMVVVDTKRNIHLRSSEDDFMDSEEKIPFQFQAKKISYMGEDIIVGCTNGSVFKINPQSGTQTHLGNLSSEITYLECFEDTIIVSCNGGFKMYGAAQAGAQPDELKGKVTKAYRYNDQSLLLVKKDCAIELIDTRTGAITMSRMLADSTGCSAQAYRDGLVVISTDDNCIAIWKIKDDPNALELKQTVSDSQITALALSADKSVIAIGCANGIIEVCCNFACVASHSKSFHYF